MAKHVGLGRGLGALIKDTVDAEPGSGSGINNVPLANVHKGPWQPRHTFDESALEDLVRSVQEHGVVQPLLVRKVDTGYELIAGERRLRAAERAGIDTVPVIVLAVSDQEALELALIENLQREDLNPVEEAEGYQLLIDTFELTQEQIASRVGKARATVANALRLLDLSDAIHGMIIRGGLSAGHAKVLLQVSDAGERDQLAATVLREGLSVRALEKRIARQQGRARKRRRIKPDIPPDHLQYLSDSLHRHFGTSVRIHPCRTLPNGKKTKGSVEIDYYSSDELDRLLSLFGIEDDL